MSLKRHKFTGLSMILIRSIIFNIFFYGFTVLCCIGFLPVLLLSRNALLSAIMFYLRVSFWLERSIIGLSYEVRGAEYLPKQGTVIVAAKHQSAYETLKLHLLLGDPTIVLKKELLGLPLFGIFLKTLGVIAIDRRNKEESIKAIIDGAEQMKKSNRPILIFPQGTRVAPDQSAKDKPYKGGIAKMYEYTGLPIVPLALNSGLFWGRNSFIKRPGKVVFEFLPAIESGLPDKKVMKAIEDRLEEASIRLMVEAKKQNKALKNLKIPHAA